MESIKNVLNGLGDPAITYFNGAITQSQLISILIIVVVCLILLKVVKKGIKLVVFLCTIGVIIFNLTNFSPTKLLDSNIVLATPELKEQLVSLSDKSDMIKIESDIVSVKINDNWINVNDIKSLINLEDGTISLNVDGKDIVIDDEKIIELLNLFVKIV